MNIRVIIVDDEKLAREKIKRLLREETDIEIIAECANGTEAVAAIDQKRADLVFLDIQMPVMNGFEVLRKIPPEKMPLIIFVTAFDQYAIRAFDIHALDYLLKPFDRERLHLAVERVREQMVSAAENFDERIISLLEGLKPRRDYPDRLVVKTGGRIYFVKTAEIDWVEAAGNYVKLHIREKTHLLRETMKGIEKKLSPRKFIRIHRSSLVNIDSIKELHPLFNGDYTVILRDRTELALSRNYHLNLTRLIERFS